MLKRMLENGRSGFYFGVVKQGFVEAGALIEKVHGDETGVSVADLNRIYRDGCQDANLLRRAANLEALPESWREYLAEELKTLGRKTGMKEL
jgi:MOSC domain-containing protein YiiM